MSKGEKNEPLTKSYILERMLGCSGIASVLIICLSGTSCPFSRHLKGIPRNPYVFMLKEETRKEERKSGGCDKGYLREDW